MPFLNTDFTSSNFLRNYSLPTVPAGPQDYIFPYSLLLKKNLLFVIYKHILVKKTIVMELQTQKSLEILPKVI